MVKKFKQRPSKLKKGYSQDLVKQTVVPLNFNKTWSEINNYFHHIFKYDVYNCITNIQKVIIRIFKPELINSDSLTFLNRVVDY